MIYSFDEEVAKEVGVNAAIIMDKFTWWIRQAVYHKNLRLIEVERYYE